MIQRRGLDTHLVTGHGDHVGGCDRQQQEVKGRDFEHTPHLEINATCFNRNFPVPKWSRSISIRYISPFYFVYFDFMESSYN